MRSTLIQEEWRPVPEYIGLYEVSNFGRVRSLDRWKDNGAGGFIQKGRILKVIKQKEGYIKINLYKNKIIKTCLVHRLVYEAFNGEMPEGMEVNHINEIKTDNSLWNLNLMTPKENNNYGKRIEKCSYPVLQLTLDDKLVKEWPSAMETGRNGFNQKAVSDCCNGRRKTHKGFKWRKNR